MADNSLPSVFPFMLHATEKGWSDYNFLSAFMKAKPEKLIWYGYDVIVRSPTEITFRVYNMRDSCYGGLGDKIAEINAEVEAHITGESINNRIMFLAQVMREEALDRIESDAIAKYAEQIRETI